MVKKISLICIALFTMASVANASDTYNDRSRDRGRDRVSNERYVIDMYDQEFRGRSNNTIHIKKLLKQQYGLRFSNDRYELKRVKLVAKSRAGRGTASLSVGQNRTYPTTVGGSRRDWNGSSMYSYDRIKMNNPGFWSQGRWQIKFEGNVKVKRVVVILNDKFRRDRPGRPGRPGNDSFLLSCSNFSRGTDYCYAGGRIVNAYVSHKMSNSPCNKGTSWGIDGDSIWVANGCRANFRVTVRQGYGRR